MVTYLSILSKYTYQHKENILVSLHEIYLKWIPLVSLSVFLLIQLEWLLKIVGWFT